MHILRIVGSTNDLLSLHQTVNIVNKLFLFLLDILAEPSLVSTVRLKVTSPMNPSVATLTMTHNSVHLRFSRTKYLDLSNPTTNPVSKKEFLYINSAIAI